MAHGRLVLCGDGSPGEVNVIAFIFVYSATNFSVSGAEPIKVFAPSTSYAQASVAIASEDEGSLDRGIYGTSAEGDDPEFSALDGTSGVDYDVVIYREKDPWPSLVDPELVASELAAVGSRVHSAFSSLTDDQMKTFLLTKGL